MSAEQFANLSQSTLNGAITSVATTVVVLTAATFPLVPQFRIRVDHATIVGMYEFMLVTAVSTNTFTVTRGIEGTAGTAFPSGSQVTHVWTAGGIANAFMRADQAQTIAGELTGPDFKATGAASLGSSHSVRMIGGWTTAGAPTGLTAQVMDFGYDNNLMPWICTVAGTPGTWKSYPNFFKSWAVNNANQGSITTATFTKVSLQTKNYDPSVSFDNVTNYRFTVPTAAPGYYLISGVVSFNLGAQTGRVLAAIFKNGSEVIGSRGAQYVGANNIIVSQPTTTVILSLVATDYIELYGFHAAAANATITGTGNDNCGLSVHFLSGV